MRAGGWETHKEGGDATNARTRSSDRQWRRRRQIRRLLPPRLLIYVTPVPCQLLNDVFKSELAAFLFSCAHPSLNPSSVNVFWGSHFIGFFSSDVSVVTEKFRGLHLCDGFHVHGT
jgi:hypothetical protein